MSADEFMKHQFITLREEIRESKARIFRLVLLGTVLVPAIGYLSAMQLSYFIVAPVPFLVLIILAAYVGEQNAIIRAGRYLREHVEPAIQGVTGWEKWLESSKRYREADRVFFAVFTVIFFMFYMVSTGTSLEVLRDRAPGQYYPYALGGYCLGAAWFLLILFRHWHSCTTTKD